MSSADDSTPREGRPSSESETAAKRKSPAAKKTAVCAICQHPKGLRDGLYEDLIQGRAFEALRQEPGLEPGDFVCFDCLRHTRSRHVERILQAERGEVSALEQDVVRSLREHELISNNLNDAFARSRTFGDRVADLLTTFGGSWIFISIFAAFLIAWIVLNTLQSFQKTFDPYPFILLNLLLSCLAAIQAPIILMSQKREEAKDRMRSEYDYKINLKAELEIRHLNAKFDLLLVHQWQRLLEIQKIQIEMLENVTAKKGKAAE
ncbi:MAG TPA: DUF1003 domain-containing protein [Planctomycetota bacterium]|jgi:uncharacterized membrane protein|nr:DUF1003 domain-containing protein [Planctomycetota bacterium]